MPFKTPLTYAELRAIRERQPWNADVLALLWEVKRLRTYPLRLHQIADDLNRPAGITGGIFDDMMDAVPHEPCVQERDQNDGGAAGGPSQTAKGHGAAVTAAPPAPLWAHRSVRGIMRPILWGLLWRWLNGLKF